MAVKVSIIMIAHFAAHNVRLKPTLNANFFSGARERAVGHVLLPVRIPREDQPQRSIQNRNWKAQLSTKRRAITWKKVLPGPGWPYCFLTISSCKPHLFNTAFN
jgi:hypothetical protein